MDDLLDQGFNRSDRLQGHHRAKSRLHHQLHVTGSDLVRLDVNRAELEFFEELERMLQIHTGNVRRIGLFRGKPAKMIDSMY